MHDYMKLEMRMAELMSQQEASGFRFDMEAATRVRSELQQEFDDITKQILSTLSLIHISEPTRPY